MSETMLNTLAQDYLDLTLSKSRYDEIDIQWFTESPFWRRTSMRYSREYKILPDYEIGDLKHGKALRDILDESENLIGLLKAYRATAQEQELARIDYIIEHVTSVHVRAQLLSGQTMSYDEMTDGLYGLVAPEYDPKPMQDLLSDLQQVLPGSGSVQEKIAAFRSRITVPTEHLLQVLTGATQFFHDETVRHMHVTGNSMPRVRVRALADPRSDFLSILFGYDYNHLEYERNFNTLVRWSADKIVECIGHEMEPGHLTYYEKRTQAMIDTCWPEMAVVSQYSPSSAFTEGSARAWRKKSTLSVRTFLSQQGWMCSCWSSCPCGIATWKQPAMPSWKQRGSCGITSGRPSRLRQSCAAVARLRRMHQMTMHCTWRATMVTSWRTIMHGMLFAATLHATARPCRMSGICMSACAAHICPCAG